MKRIHPQTSLYFASNFADKSVITKSLNNMADTVRRVTFILLNGLKAACPFHKVETWENRNSK